MSAKKNSSNNPEKPQNAYFISLELENVRCFSEKQKIDFSDDNENPKQWTIILGDNGTGKTTILKCILIISPEISMVNGERESFGARHRYFPKESFYRGVELDYEQNFSIKGYYSGQWNIHEKGRKQISSILATSHLSKGQHVGTSYEYGRNFSNSTQQQGKVHWRNSIIFAYGASRKAGLTSLSEPNKDFAYKTLFDETALLVNAEEWLLQADYALKRNSGSSEKRKRELELVIDILKKVLPDVDNIRSAERKDSGRIPKPIVEFHTSYGWVEAKDLSLGYRTSMAWMVDFASRMFHLYPESENPLAEPAVVLIDEIDLHLHPKWQRELIDYLTNLFPNTQFIVTTHSPLIVQAAAARDANIVVCRREGDHVVIDQSIEAVKNWRADQILTSELFDLPTARPKKIEPFLEERQEILSKPKLTKKDEKRLQELEEKIGFMPVSEDNPEDDKAMDIIRRAAERLQSQAE